jgi:Arc/MetJ family transcription regulator
MKMTMHIDEKLLQRVMEHHNFESKTEAVDFALREIDRKAKLRAYAKTGLGFTAKELKEGVYADYDVVALRVAETPAKHGKRAARR